MKDDCDYNELVRARLEKILTKKCQTIFIGALADIEEHFGHLWGIDKSESELTDAERQWLEIWKDLRYSILDRGNFQLSNILKEIDQHEISKRVYNYKFKPKRHPNF